MCTTRNTPASAKENVLAAFILVAPIGTLPGGENTTYPEGMPGVPRSILLSWESKVAAARRRRERDAAVAREVLLSDCERCGAGSGEHCRTAKGWAADKAHAQRQREAEATVDARLGYLGENPVAVPDA